MSQLGQGTNGWPAPVRQVATKLFLALDLETLKSVCAKAEFIVRPERADGDREDWVAAAIDAVAAQHPPSFLLSFGLSRGCLTKFFFACGDCNCGVLSLARTKQLQEWAGLMLEQGGCPESAQLWATNSEDSLWDDLCDKERLSSHAKLELASFLSKSSLQQAVQDICIQHGISASSRQPRPSTVTREAGALVDAFEEKPVKLLCQLKPQVMKAVLRHCGGTVHGSDAQRWQRQLMTIWIKHAHYAPKDSNRTASGSERQAVSKQLVSARSSKRRRSPDTAGVRAGESQRVKADVPKQARADNPERTRSPEAKRNRSDVSTQHKHGKADEMRHSKISSVLAKERRDNLSGDGRHGGSLKGGSLKGDSVKGGSVKGDSVKGGSVEGGSLKGDNLKGGNLKGGNLKGGSLKGGSLHGGHVSASAKATSKAGSSEGVRARVKMSRDAQEAEVAPVAKPKLHAVARLPRRTQYQLDKAYSPYKAAPWALRYTGKICSLGFDDFKELDRNLSESRRLVMADYLAAQVARYQDVQPRTFTYAQLGQEMVQVWSEMLIFDNLVWAVNALKKVESEPGTILHVSDHESEHWSVKWMHAERKRPLGYDIVVTPPDGRALYIKVAGTKQLEHVHGRNKMNIDQDACIFSINRGHYFQIYLCQMWVEPTQN